MLVFGASAGEPLARPEDVDWEGMKTAERTERGEHRESVLDGVPITLSGMTRALKLTRRAATVGFDWTDPKDVLNHRFSYGYPFRIIVQHLGQKPH